MKKRIIGVLCAVFLAGSMGMVAYASPQKPFSWQGYVNSYTFDWSDDTAVEMRNGDGTDVMTVNGQYIVDHMLPSTIWPLLMDDGSLPSHVKTVSCQVVKEDAYIIMPFDGYVTIWVEDDDIAGDYARVWVRAKAGDKVNMVPRNLVMTYSPDDEWEQCYVGTSPDDWTYNLRIYKEEFIPLCPEEWRKMTYRDREGNIIPTDILPDELISRPLYSGQDTYACLWFIYQVDAPNSTLRAIPYDWKACSLADNPGKGFYGWTKDPRVAGREIYHANNMRVDEWLGWNPSITVELYQSGKLTVKDNELYIEGRKVNTWAGYGSGSWIDPQYNIVNVP